MELTQYYKPANAVYFYAKIFCLVVMLIDHIGAFLYPQFGVLRLIGRLCVGLYFYFFACSLNHYLQQDFFPNRKAYLKKDFPKTLVFSANLFLLGLVADIPFILFFNGSWLSSIFGYYGLIGIYVYALKYFCSLVPNKYLKRALALLIWVLGLGFFQFHLTQVTTFTYGGLGYVLITFFLYYGVSYKHKVDPLAILSCFGLSFPFSSVAYAQPLFIILMLAPLLFISLFQELFPQFTDLEIMVHKKTSAFFWLFYPVHLYIIGIISYWVGAS